MNEIDTSGWGEFKVGELFSSITRATRRTINSYTEGGVPYVTNSAFNNGITGYLEPKSAEDIERGQCITINTVDGRAFWQEGNFLANSSGNGLIMLRKSDMNRHRALFICAAISANLAPSFTVMLTMGVIRDLVIRLPVTDEGEPDWGHMEETMRGVMVERERALDLLERLLPDEADHERE